VGNGQILRRDFTTTSRDQPCRGEGNRQEVVRGAQQKFNAQQNSTVTDSLRIPQGKKGGVQIIGFEG